MSGSQLCMVMFASQMGIEVFEVVACSEFIHSHYIVGDQETIAIECVCIVVILHG